MVLHMPPRGRERDRASGVPRRPAQPLPPAPTPRERPLGTIGLLWALRTNPLLTWTRAHYREPILSGRSVLGDLVIVSEPSAIRHVLVDNAANYRKDDLQLRLLGPGLGGGLLTAEGDVWRAQRRALAPLFTPRLTERFRPAMQASAEWLAERLRRQRDGRRIDMAGEFSRATLDVLERTIFPQGLGGEPTKFIEAVTRYFDTAGRIEPFDILGLPDWAPRFGRNRAAPALAFFGEAVEAMIETARRNAASGATANAPDLMSLLLAAADPETGRGLGDAEVRANILTFIGAGHETTANALTWATYLLATHPEWRERAEAEVDAAGALDPEHLPIVRAIVDEALRLYPPAASLSREAIGPDRVADLRIRPGARVVISPWLLHRHERLWRDPGAFDPGRFLPGRREEIDRFAYLPFGAGPRICIGAGFALQEAVVILAAMLREFRFDPAPGHVVEPIQRVTLRPKNGMPMILRKRQASGGAGFFS
ncbi:MAG: cytochrome [Hyphomicrobiales bacterium]|nr:cytochrome [Hyphomicrobiales bacterium]